MAGILAAASKAMGGEDALRRIQSIHGVADCVSPRGVNYRTEITSARQNLLMFKQSWPDRQPFIAFVNGQHAWTRESDGTVKPLDKNNEAAIRGHEFQMIAIEPFDRYKEAVVEGRETFAHISAIKLRALDELGNPGHIFFDTKTRLMLGLIITNPVGKDSETVKIVFKGWKQVGEVTLPSVVVTTDKAGDFVFNFREITLNKVDKSIFDLPDGVEEIRHAQNRESAHWSTVKLKQEDLFQTFTLEFGPRTIALEGVLLC